VGHNFKRFFGYREKTPEKRRLLTTAGAEVVGDDAGGDDAKRLNKPNIFFFLCRGLGYKALT
jgi:hypothetical protein